MPGEIRHILRFKKLTEHATAPTKGSVWAAGYDLSSAYDLVVPAEGKALVKTDIQIELPDGCYGRVAPRSGLSWKNHIDVGAGVIDRDYRGNVGVVLFNHAKTDFEVKKGDRVAQLICEKIVYPDLQEVEVDEEDEDYYFNAVEEDVEKIEVNGEPQEVVKVERAKRKVPWKENYETGREESMEVSGQPQEAFDKVAQVRTTGKRNGTVKKEKNEPVTKSPKKATKVLNQDEDTSVPKGWSRLEVKRSSGASKGKFDVYYISPLGKKLRSKAELSRHCKENHLDVNMDKIVFTSQNTGPAKQGARPASVKTPKGIPRKSPKAPRT